MLKIKDNVDLKELEKFGISFLDDKESSYYGCCEYFNNDISLFINNAKVISLNQQTGRTIFDIEVLYDLIQAGLVEKEEN